MLPSRHIPQKISFWQEQLPCRCTSNPVTLLLKSFTPLTFKVTAWSPKLPDPVLLTTLASYLTTLLSNQPWICQNHLTCYFLEEDVLWSKAPPFSYQSSFLQGESHLAFWGHTTKTANTFSLGFNCNPDMFPSSSYWKTTGPKHCLCKNWEVQSNVESKDPTWMAHWELLVNQSSASICAWGVE